MRGFYKLKAGVMTAYSTTHYSTSFELANLLNKYLSTPYLPTHLPK
jgi:hypothetical protein